MCAMKAKRPQRAVAHATHSSNKAASKVADRDSSHEPRAGELLKSKQRSIRDGFPSDVGLRVHRAISWLQRAEQEQQDDDAAFIFYWIAFNAIYADSLSDSPTDDERRKIADFFRHLTDLDHKQRIYGTLFQKYPDSILKLMDNKYVFGPFWKHANGTPGYDEWARKFEDSKFVVSKSLREGNTKKILTTLFDRLYVLRNQLVHGGATWNSSVNRDQVRDGTHIIATLVPIFIDLIMDNPNEPWGAPYYPVVD